MTHSGGRPHNVGDGEGLRYAVSVFDENKGERINLAYTNDAKHAAEMATAAELRPSWKFAWVTDRQPSTVNGGQ